jgi:putative spermidine/putrescine transport system ATP-binding protein
VSAVPAVELHGVSKRYGAVRALEETTLVVERGEFLTLLGPSGCGKTTLLGLVAGFAEPDTGSIRIFGRDVTNLPTFLRDVGVVFQNYALFPHMSVADNVAFGLRLRNMPKAEIRDAVEAVLTTVRMQATAKRRPSELSGGQQQRVALARALVVQPKVLLLDEPLSALDKNLRSEMQVELKQIQEKVGITTIFVTHDQGEALSLSDRVAVMSAGAIQQLSVAADIYRRPANAFVASFIGDINQIPVRIVGSEDGDRTVELPSGTRKRVPAARLQPECRTSGRGTLFVRTQGIRMVTPPAADFHGNRVHEVYLGTHLEVIFAVEGLPPLRARIGDPDNVHFDDPAAPVPLAIAEDAIVLLTNAVGAA